MGSVLGPRQVRDSYLGSVLVKPDGLLGLLMHTSESSLIGRFSSSSGKRHDSHGSCCLGTHALWPWQLLLGALAARPGGPGACDSPRAPLPRLS